MKRKYKYIVGIVLGLGFLIYVICLQYFNIVNIKNSRALEDELDKINTEISVLSAKQKDLLSQKNASSTELDSLKQNLTKLEQDLKDAASKFAQYN